MSRILLVEPWLAGSHRAWAEGYREASRHDVHLIGLPGRTWRWRMRGGAVPLAADVDAWVAEHGRPDALLVSAMVDVAQLVGLARRSLAGPAATPVVVYQHENQLRHATPDGAVDTEAALRAWTSWVAADTVLFNSDVHRRAVVDAIPRFLAGMPDRDHLRFVDAVTGRFGVAPVGVDLDWLPNRPGGAGRAEGAGSAAARWDGGSPVVLWPHRWEQDKDPGAFVRAVDRAAAAGIPFRLVLAGEDPEAGSESATSIRRAVADRHPDRVVAVGPFDVADYRRWLARADLVVSCTRHEWFGVAVVEAVAAGCVPVLPDAHAYPEIIPARWHTAALYRPGRFGSALTETLVDLASRRSAVAGLAGAVTDRYRWPVVAAGYDARIDALVRIAGPVRPGMTVRQSS
ncbi:MAG: DUF3524 domain-containing protein [Acidimicrobiales bacterium]